MQITCALCSFSGVAQDAFQKGKTFINNNWDRIEAAAGLALYGAFAYGMYNLPSKKFERGVTLHANADQCPLQFDNGVADYQNTFQSPAQFSCPSLTKTASQLFSLNLGRFMNFLSPLHKNTTNTQVVNPNQGTCPKLISHSSPASEDIGSFEYGVQVMLLSAIAGIGAEIAHRTPKFVMGMIDAYARKIASMHP